MATNRAGRAGETRVLAADAAGIADAAAILRGGGLVAFPTETVYGLGGDATDPAAIAGIYAAKGRPAKNPLIAHLADPEEAADWAEAPDIARALAAAFWPGPLTLVLPKRPGAPLPEALTDPAPARLFADEAAEAFAAFRARPKKERNRILAASVARALSAPLADKAPPLVETLIETAGAAPRAVWTPDATFFKRLTKDQLLAIEAGIMGREAPAPDLAKQPKGKLVAHLAAIFSGEGVALSPEQQARAAAWVPEGM